jgi:thiamine biosynthesis lipoprotein
MRKLLPIAALIFVLLSSGFAKPEAERNVTNFVLGTVCSIRVPQGGIETGRGKEADTAIAKAFARLAQLEAELTVNKEGSQIDAVNAAAGLRPVKVGADAIAILKKGLSYAALSEGAFDPSVGPLVKLWGIGTDHARVPSSAEIATALAHVGWRDVLLDETAGTVFLKRRGMALDLGSATKGYAADEVAVILRAGGVKSAVIDLGGNVLVVGAKPDASPWRVGLQNPSADRNTYVGIARLADKTMVTSGIYERFFEQGGVHYHHILDTKTGFPVQNGLTSVTIITAKSFDADGVTTMLFALGREKGMALAKKLGIDVIMLDDKRHVYMTPAVSTFFQITDPSYVLAE